ncbi:MAG: TIGR02996 domain-containing protein [Archangium sp.]|nr:TIGR02996 domain-containing protein [Archangium sp.]
MQRTDEPAELLPLFDAVFDRPADDAPRQVLADALLERGDARGEFISLQLLEARGVATAAQRTRAANLLKHHVRRWLIEVPGLVQNSLEFHRGFLRAVTLEPTGVGAQSPLWRSVEDLHVRATQYPAEELNAASLTRLETLTGLDGASLSIVVRSASNKPCLREVVVNGPAVEDARLSRQQEDVLALSRFKTLEALTLSPRPWRHHADRLTWFFEAPIARQLQRVRFAAEPPWDVFGLHGLLIEQRLMRLRVEPFTPGLALSFDCDRLTVRFDDGRSLDRHAQTVRNLGPKFAPAPFSRFAVQIADRRATRTELERLGELFLRHAG